MFSGNRQSAPTTARSTSKHGSPTNAITLLGSDAVHSVLVLDDAHALSGRKLNLAVRLAQTARLVVMGAVSEQALHPSLRVCLQRRAPQVLLMSSEVPYDATLNLMWLILLLALAAGWWELAAALSTVRALGHGPLATRQR